MSTLPSIHGALASVMEDVRAVRKGDRNNAQNYAFRGIDAVMNAVGPVLRKHGVVVVPLLEDVTYRDVQTSTGKSSRECTVMVRYRFYGPGGDYIDCIVPGESLDFGDKGAPKAMSVAYRIALLQALCLPTDDTDPDAESYERAAPARAPRQTRAPQSAAKPAGSPEERARTAVGALLAAGSEDAVTKVHKRVRDSDIKDNDVAKLLAPEDLEVLDLAAGAEITLVQLANRVMIYVGKHHTSVQSARAAA